MTDNPYKLTEDERAKLSTGQIEFLNAVLRASERRKIEHNAKPFALRALLACEKFRRLIEAKSVGDTPLYLNDMLDPEATALALAHAPIHRLGRAATTCLRLRKRTTFRPGEFDKACNNYIDCLGELREPLPKPLQLSGIELLGLTDIKIHYTLGEKPPSCGFCRSGESERPCACQDWSNYEFASDQLPEYFRDFVEVDGETFPVEFATIGLLRFDDLDPRRLSEEQAKLNLLQMVITLCNRFSEKAIGAPVKDAHQVLINDLGLAYERYCKRKATKSNTHALGLLSSVLIASRIEHIALEYRLDRWDARERETWAERRGVYLKTAECTKSADL